MPLVIRACHLYGDDENSLVLAHSAEFAQSQVTLRAVLERLPQAVKRDVNLSFHYHTIIANARPDVLEPLMPELRKHDHLQPGFLEILEERLEVTTWGSERLWAELEQVAQAGEGKFIDEFAFHRGLDLVQCIARSEETTQEMVLDRLLNSRDSYFGIYMTVLAGLMRITGAIPELINRLDQDSDLDGETAGDALVQIGTEDAVKQLSDRFPAGNWDFRLFAAPVPGRIKSPQAEQALLDILPGEPDLTIKTVLADGLCQLMSERGLPLVRETIRQGYDHRLLDLERSVYVTSVVLGQAERKHWAGEAANEPAAAPTAPWPRRKIGSNELCPCGSGQKFKRCCLGKGEQGPDIEYRRLDNSIQEGYRLLRSGEPEKACEVWLKAWEGIRSTLGPRSDSVKEADQIFQGSEFLSNWCQDLEMELVNLGRKDRAYYEKHIDYCRQFTLEFPESSELIIQNTRRAEAESYYALGFPIQGEIAFQTLIRDYPDWPWGYIGWGDMYWLHMPGRSAEPDYDRAEEIYLWALDRVEDEHQAIRERLEDLRARRGEGIEG